MSSSAESSNDSCLRRWRGLMGSYMQLCPWSWQRLHIGLTSSHFFFCDADVRELQGICSQQEW